MTGHGPHGQGDTHEEEDGEGGRSYERGKRTNVFRVYRLKNLEADATKMIKIAGLTPPSSLNPVPSLDKT